MYYGSDVQLQEDMRSGQIELDKYIITKSLTKQPEDYPDGKNQPHVQVQTCALFCMNLSFFSIFSKSFLFIVSV